jgi:hypothetical protein
MLAKTDFLQSVLKVVGPVLTPTRPDTGRSKIIACPYDQQTKCPLYAEGCFDFSHMYCKGPLTPKEAQWPQTTQKTSKQQPAAVLWSDEPDGLSPSPFQPAQRLCAQASCDSLDPVEASLCRCLSTASDPSTCPGVSRDASSVAAVARRACIPEKM